MSMDTPARPLVVDTPTRPLAEQYSDIRWGAVIAGAVAAAALAFVLEGFALGIGFSVSSTAPTWRDTSIALVLASGFYLVLVALASYAFGGYVAARAYRPAAAGTVEAGEFRDGLHGLIVWGLGTLLTGLLALGAVQATARLAAPSGSSAGPATSVGGENLLAFDLDRLFRGAEGRAQNMAYDRAEAARILFTASSHRGLQQDDRAYLVRLVSATTGAAAPDAERRVNEAVTSAQDNIARARRSGVVLAFMLAAAALLGAAVAWYAAVEGGRHRDGRVATPTWLDWARPTTRPW
jgi:hypothetical protein